MSAESALRYRELFVELLAAREARGPLSRDEEADYQRKIELCWYELTEGERQEIEAEALVQDPFPRGETKHEWHFASNVYVAEPASDVSRRLALSVYTPTAADAREFAAELRQWAAFIDGYCAIAEIKA